MIFTEQSTIMDVFMVSTSYVLLIIQREGVVVAAVTREASFWREHGKTKQRNDKTVTDRS